MKPVCVPCERFMRPKKNDYKFLEGMPTTSRPQPGKGSNDWVPYKLWAGDLWECPDCGYQTIAGVAHQPLAEHFEPNFRSMIESYGGVKLMIKDC